MEGRSRKTQSLDNEKGNMATSNGKREELASKTRERRWAHDMNSNMKFALGVAL